MAENKDYFKKIEREFKELNIESLDVLKKDFSIRSYAITNEDLVTDIETYGLLEPLVVAGPFYKKKDTSKENGKFFILDGYERYKAVQKINNIESCKAITTLPCYILKGNFSQLDLSALRLQLGACNKTKPRKEIWRFYTLDVLCELAQHGEIDESKIIKHMSMSQNLDERTAHAYAHTYLHGTEELISAVIRDREIDGRKPISLSYADRIAGKDKETQKEILERIYGGERPKDVLDDYPAKGKKDDKKSDSDEPADKQEVLKSLMENPEIAETFSLFPDALEDIKNLIDGEENTTKK